MCEVLGIDLVPAPSLSIGLVAGGWFGRFACGELVARIGGSAMLMEGFGSYRWYWDPSGCLEPNDCRPWIQTNIGLIWGLQSSLLAIMEGSIRCWAGTGAAILALGKRRCTISSLPYLFREVAGYWAWAFDPYGLVFSVLISVYICCFLWFLFVCITNYLWMWHNSHLSCWCTGCAWLTRSAEGVLFLCCFTWNSVFAVAN